MECLNESVPTKKTWCQNKMKSIFTEDLSDDKLNQLIEAIDEMLVNLEKNNET
jgi:hypothetical protein